MSKVCVNCLGAGALFRYAGIRETCVICDGKGEMPEVVPQVVPPVPSEVQSEQVAQECDIPEDEKNPRGLL